MDKMRKEYDTMGCVEVPSERKWGAQTARSLEHFSIGSERIPTEIIRAFAALKSACAEANHLLRPEKMTYEKKNAIVSVCEDILSGKLDGEFPLFVWQTGSGTHTNMNVNEVVANVAAEKFGVKLHPNDDVNMSQSSNDTFPSALNIAVLLEIEKSLVPSLERLINSFKKLEEENRGVVKCGRTHLQDAVPLTFAQEISGWRSALERDRENIIFASKGLSHIAIGGTAVGTGLNAPENFGKIVAEKLTEKLGVTFSEDENKFRALSSLGGAAFAHGAIKTLVCDLMKIANDIRLLASGPRCGLGEITIPANEPGSSIMPGKVNPTQCEAITMIAAQVIGNDTTVSVAASQGQFQLNVYQPVTAYNCLQSIKLLSDGMASFEKFCVSGIKPNLSKMEENMKKSLMTVTCLTPYIGYENAAKIAKKAESENVTLRDAAVLLGIMTAEEFDEKYHPEKMTGDK